MYRPIDIFVGLGRLPLVRLQRAAVRNRLNSIDVTRRESRPDRVAQDPAGVESKAGPDGAARH